VIKRLLDAIFVIFLGGIMACMILSLWHDAYPYSAHLAAILAQSQAMKIKTRTVLPDPEKFNYF
jgi:hypothetical protein